MNGKKKIGILTYIYALNHGSILQAIAVKNILSNAFPEAEIKYINYAPKRGFKKEVLNNIINKRMLSGVKILWKFSQIIRKEFTFWPGRLISDNYEEAIKFVDKLDVDIIAIGSDTVFESRPKGLGYAPFPPNIYFGSDKLACKKISVAASADRSLIEYWDKSAVEVCGNSINKFKYLSVRDRFTKDMLIKLFDVSKTNVRVVPDPTFYVNHKYNFEKLSKKLNIKKGNYVVLDISDKGLSKLIRNMFKDKKIKIISPMTNRYSDMNLRGKINQNEWVDLHSNSMINLTNRFHATVFSIKSGNNFISFDESMEYDKGAGSKKYDLLNDINENSRYIHLSQVSHREVIQRISDRINCYDDDEKNKLIMHANNYREKWLREIINIKNSINYKEL
jgi:hypothetical protein